MRTFGTMMAETVSKRKLNDYMQNIKIKELAGIDGWLARRPQAHRTAQFRAPDIMPKTASKPQKARSSAPFMTRS